MKIRRFISLMLAVCMVFALAACGSSSEGTAETEAATEAAAAGAETEAAETEAAAESEAVETEAPAEAAEPQKIVVNATESESWDPLRESQAGNLIASMFEGLTAYENGELTLAVASNIELADDGLSAHVTLREDSLWSDGKQVTANDFAYAMLRQLNPENAGKYAADLYMLKNAKAYNSGEAAAEDVGIEVVGDFEMNFTFEAPVTMTDFQEVLAARVAMPVREDAVAAGENWWADATTCFCNGPFKLDSYTPGDMLVMVKNDQYYDADKVQITEIDWRFITDAQVELMAYQNDELQIGIMPPADSLQSFADSGELHSAAKITCYWLIVNCENDALKDARVRKALAMAIDRDAIVASVTKGGEIPAYSLISPQITDQSTGQVFNEVNGNQFEYNVEEAQKLLAEAGYPNGEGFPEITYGTSSGSYHGLVAQAVVDMWKQNLGITVAIEEEESSVFIEDRKAGKFPLARYTNSSNFTSPDAMLKLYLSDSATNDSKYKSEEYDELVKSAETTADVTERYKFFQDANAKMIDDMAVIPLFYPVNNFIVKGNLKGVGISPGGRLDFKNAYFE